MRHLGSKVIACAAGLTVFGAAALAANAESSPNAPARATMTVDGPVLVSSKGMTLYVFSADKAGQPTCTNTPDAQPFIGMGGGDRYRTPAKPWPTKTCAQKWPPYLAEVNAQPTGDFGLVERAEGKQWTWQGKPLYLSSKDKTPGERWGASFQFVSAYQGTSQGLGRRGAGDSFRYAAAPFELPPALRLVRFENDLVIATANSQPAFTPGKGANLDLLTPILAADLAKVSGDWSTVDRGDGRKQYAFKGKLLYAVPEDAAVVEIADAGGWDVAVFEKGADTPPDIQTRYSYTGDVYTTRDGLTLYAFSCGGGNRGSKLSCDDPGDAAGYWVAICGSGQECAKRWKPYIASAGAKPSGEWTIVDVSTPLFTDPAGTTYPPDTPRVRAWAHRGKPVFTFYEDKVAGDIWGHNIGWALAGAIMNAVQPPGRIINRGG